MKSLFIVATLFIANNLFGQVLEGKVLYPQVNEFGKSNNELIYSDSSLNQLKFIVDSLNIKFKTCKPNKTYLSKFQSKAHFISLKNGNIIDVVKDIEANISFNEFIKKYSKSQVEKELLVVKFKYKNYQEQDVIEFSSIEFDDKYNHEFNFEKDLKKYDEPLKGKWIYRYYDKTKHSNASISAFYFIEEFSQRAIPNNFARMIQYADFMVDTSTKIFYEKAYRSTLGLRNEQPSKSKEFMDYIDKSTNKPKYNLDKNEINYEEIYSENYHLWDSLKLSKVDSLKIHDEKFNKLLNEAIKEAFTKGATSNEFETYVGRYYSKKTELELKRNRTVVGGCSQDNAPIEHAINIAKLSAETNNWEIFLRSHLDILNDRFERISDGSYAWDQRKTYIKELEVLDINVLDLFLGISLRIENPSKNHYYGNIGRIGMAISESKKAKNFETIMLQMVKDNKLDDYNRILIYNLFQSYIYHLEDKNRQSVNKMKLMTAVKSLPKYLSTQISTQ